jgi:hypothetical protein
MPKGPNGEKRAAAQLGSLGGKKRGEQDAREAG